MPWHIYNMQNSINNIYTTKKMYFYVIFYKYIKPWLLKN